jgi:hypothetical protein
MITEDFPRLFQFLGAYFHEDWMCEFDLANEVVESFVADSDELTMQQVLKEIEILLGSNLTENNLRDFLLKEMGCSYCYWNEWASGKIWLRHIEKKLNDSLADPTFHP